LTGIGANVAYSYIGAGTDRYNKTVSGTTTQFLYDEGSVDEEMQGTTVTADYSAGAEKLSGTLYWMLQDGQGSTRRLLNSSQATVASYTTDAYGNSVASSGSAANPFQWNGGTAYYSDAESGLQKVGARYYEPATGRWISQDTELIAGSPADSQAVNRYLYCGANSIGRVDPGGRGTPEFVSALLGERTRNILGRGIGIGLLIQVIQSVAHFNHCPWLDSACSAAQILNVAITGFCILAVAATPADIVVGLFFAGAGLYYGVRYTAEIFSPDV
jgi:RHS repeat-associated protein